MDGRLYDLLTQRAERTHFAPLRAELLSALSGRIVEVGAGTGLNFPYYPAGAFVTAIEPDARMLRRAEFRAQAASATIELVAAADDALDAISPESVDAVVIALGLCTIAEPRRTLQRVRRVLRPAGRLVLLEHVRGAGWTAVLQDIAAPLWGLVFGGCRPNQDTHELLAAGGFDSGAIRRVGLGGMSLIRDAIVGTATIATRTERPSP